MTAINDLDDSEVLTVLQSMAAASPDYLRVADQLAGQAKQFLPATEQNQLAREGLNILANDPQQSTLMKAILNNPETRQFDQKRSRIPLLIALILLLGIQVKFDYNTDGSQSFHFQYDGNNTAVVQLLKKLEHFLPKSK